MTHLERQLGRVSDLHNNMFRMAAWPGFSVETMTHLEWQLGQVSELGQLGP